MLLAANEYWLKKVSWLSNEDPMFVTNVILALRPAVFAPKEVRNPTRTET